MEQTECQTLVVEPEYNHERVNFAQIHVTGRTLGVACTLVMSLARSQ